MEKLKYEKEHGVLTVPCEHVQSIMVGSAICQVCTFNQGINFFKQTVICDYDDYKTEMDVF